jgi:hypothetical protein
MAQVVECFSSKLKALNSNPSAAKKKKKRQKKPVARYQWLMSVILKLLRRQRSGESRFEAHPGK